MNANEEVMKYFPRLLDTIESDIFVDRIMVHLNDLCYGLWAVELKQTKEFIGFIGFLTATFEAEFTPCIEIGWRLSNEYWNNGYATEGAKACLEYGFNNLSFDEVYSFTAEINIPSIKVMKKLGLTRIGEFLHPRVESGNILKPHVLYKISKSEYDIKGN